MGDDRGQHAVELDVHAELGFTVDFARSFDVFHIRADEFEVFRVLQRNVLGNGQSCRLGGELAVGGALLAIDDVSGLGCERGLVDAPILSRRFDEKSSRGGAGGPERLPRRYDASATARELHAKEEIGIFGRSRRRLDSDALPVGVELLRDQHRKRGVHALSHLGLVDDDGDDVVGCDADESVRCERPGGVNVSALGPRGGT